MTDHPMTDKDRVAAAIALIEWFKTQGIRPSDAAKIFCRVIAAELVIQKRDPLKLAKGLATVSDLLMCEVVIAHTELLKKDDCQR